MTGWADRITVAIPTIPPREVLLTRAVASAERQTRQPHAIEIAVDRDRQGAVATRNRALDAVTTPWVAFLDDDDELLNCHLEVLLEAAIDHGADYVFSWYLIVDAAGRTRLDGDPLGHFGQPWDPENPHQTTITTLVRTELAQQVRFEQPIPGRTINGQTWGEDFTFTLGCRDAGAKILHVPRHTWLWHHHGANTSGRPDRW